MVGLGCGFTLTPTALCQGSLVTCRHLAWWRHVGTGLSGPAIGWRLVVAPFPLNVGDVEKSHVIFKAHPIKVVQGQIVLHGFPKFLDCLIEFSQFRSFHGYLRCFY